MIDKKHASEWLDNINIWIEKRWGEFSWEHFDILMICLIPIMACLVLFIIWVYVKF